MNYLLTRKTNPPLRVNLQDAGIDIFLPELNQEYKSTLLRLNDKENKLSFSWNNQLVIPPNSRIRIPTGIYFKVPKHHMLLTLEKSSIPYSTGLIAGARVVDSNYQGEYFAVLINTSPKQVHIGELTKIVQVVLVPISKDVFLNQVKDMNDLHPEKSERGDGAFGSTGGV